MFALFGRPSFLKSFHKWAAIFWVIMVVPSALTGLKASVTYLVFLSIYAIVTGHWSSWQAASVEVKQDEQINESA